jgi:hypothetical protein
MLKMKEGYQRQNHGGDERQQNKNQGQRCKRSSCVRIDIKGEG